jgi:LPS export ABC transporter protein LptC
MHANGYVVYCLMVLSTALTACHNEISEIKAITDPRQMPVQTNRNATFTYTEKGRIKNKLIASKLERFQGESPYMLASSGFTMIFFDSLETEEARLTAVNGKYDETTNELIAWENVVLVNVRGEKLETEELIFAQDSTGIHTDKFVTITTVSGVIYGEGLESNDSFTKYRILKPYGDIYLKEEE